MEDKYIQFIKTKYEPIPCVGEGINLTMANYIPLQLGEEKKEERPVDERRWASGENESIWAWREEHSARRTVLTPVDVWNAIKNKRHNVVKGDPGCGKTILTHYIAYEPKDMIPLVIDLKDWAGKDISLAKYYAESTLIRDGVLGEEIKPETIKDWLRSGKCIILCDGLDEVPQDRRQTLIQSLQSLTSWNCHIVVTTRIAGYNNELSGWQHYEVMPLEKKHIEQFAKDYLKDKSSPFLSALKATPQMIPLSKNPLLLSVLCFVFKSNELVLPTQRVKLYETAVNKMLKLRNPVIPTWVKEDALKEIAVHFLGKDNKEAFKEKELSVIIGTLLKKEAESPEVKRVLEEIAEKGGLLYRYGDGRYIFLHLTFQEYFAACHIAEKVKDPCKFFEPALFNPKFREVVRLTSGMLKDTDTVSSFIKYIREQKPLHCEVLHQPLLLAGLCIADVPDDPSSPPLVEQTFLSVLNELWRLWKETEYFSLRDEINRVFAANAGKGMADNIINNLLRALKDEDSGVRWRAAEALGKLGRADDNVVEALIGALKDEYSWVRGRAAEALVKLGRADDNVVEALIGALKDKDSEVRVRWRAAEALDELGRADDKVIEALSGALEDEVVRDYAYSALQRLVEGRARGGYITLRRVFKRKEVIVKKTYTTKVGGPVRNLIIQQGDGTKAKQEIIINKDRYKELEEGIRLLKEYISNDGRNRFSQQEKDELQDRISKIEEQINSGNPNNEITKENSKRIFSILSILKEVLKGGGIHTGAIVSGHKLLEHWDKIKVLFG